jgi:hypothetical protein
MKRIDVSKQGDKWVAKQGNQTVASARTKDAAVKRTAQVARKDPDAVSVKIHKIDGKIQEERTYPRKADPSTSPG